MGKALRHALKSIRTAVARLIRPSCVRRNPLAGTAPADGPPSGSGVLSELMVHMLRIISGDEAFHVPAPCPAPLPMEHESGGALRHVAMADGQVLAAASLCACILDDPQGRAPARVIYVSRLPELALAVRARRDHGLDVEEQLLAAQLRYLDEHGVPELYVIVARKTLGKDVLRWVEMGGWLADDEAALIGLAPNVKLLRIPPVRGLRFLHAKTLTCQLVERVSRAAAVGGAAG